MNVSCSFGITALLAALRYYASMAADLSDIKVGLVLHSVILLDCQTLT